jgi:hypothetical protein
MLSQTTRKPSLSRGDFVEFRLVMQRLLKLEYFHTLKTNQKKRNQDFREMMSPGALRWIFYFTDLWWGWSY